MKKTFAFDVYGTLIDPVQMGRHIPALNGTRADDFGRLWNEKKVEYAFRRGLMGQYRDFSVCTRDALHYCLKVFDVSLSATEEENLLASYSHLEAFDDVLPGLSALKTAGCQLAAFSNGPESAVRTLLKNAGILELMDRVISVDDVKSYKPDPKVYHYLQKRMGGETALISSNPWDVIGAKAAGLGAIWLQRDPAKVFDPWDITPDRIIRNLNELA